MTSSGHYDIIIAGAGAAGLSLVRSLLQTSPLSGKRILLADRSLHPVQNKTWCFWDKNHQPFNDLVTYSWDTLDIRVNRWSCAQKLDTYRYHCLKSDEYSRKTLDLIAGRDNVSCLETEIEEFDYKGGTGLMHTSAGTFTADRIFQSVRRPPGYDSLKVDISLRQYFKGWLIRTELPVFEPDKATFMDFDIPRQNGVNFLYVLPYSQYEALVEYTVFTEDWISDEMYDDGLKAYVFDRFGLQSSDYKVLDTEYGGIPIEDRRYPGRYCNRVWNIGTVGGLAKPSTGYMFTRIRRHSKKIADALAKGEDPNVKMVSSFRFRVYDIMLLYQLQQHPETALRIFHELFRKNRLDDILRFLDEDSHIGQEIKIFSTVPYKPFFQSIWKMRCRLFSGA